MAVALMPRSVRRSPESALTVLYDRHAPALLSFARSYVGDTAAAEDVVQQTFLAAHRTLAAGTELEQPRAWLFQVARNNALMVLRERGGLRAADAVLSEELEARATQVAEQVEEREELRSVVADIVALPSDQRAALTLFELADLSQGEIATAIGVEPTKVKALVFQARSALTDQRAARDTSCATVREKLATLSGGARNSRLIRNHLRQCAGCTAYRDELRDRRRKLLLLLPVPLLPGLREAVLGKGAAAVAAGHAGAAAWLTGRTRWVAAGGGSTAAAGAIVAAIAISGGSPAKRAVEPTIASATAATPAAATAPPHARAAAAQRVTRRQTRTRTSPRTVSAAPAHAPRLHVRDQRVPERTRDAPHLAPERPAPSVTPAPSSSPGPVSKSPAAAAPAPSPGPSTSAPAAGPAPAAAPSPDPVATSSPAPASTVWPPGHRDKGDGHPAHPPHP